MIMFVETRMKGWEVYAKDWGCADWNRDGNDTDTEKWDRMFYNKHHEWPQGFYALSRNMAWRCIIIYIRQPVPVQVR